MSNVPSASANDYWLPAPAGAAPSRSGQALRFFATGALAVAGAGLLAALLCRLIGRGHPTQFQFPPAFLLSSLLLAAGSVWMNAALRAVRRERQQILRRRIRQAVVIGALFMGVQTYALWSIIPPDRSIQAASAGVAAFVVMLAFLHGCHFLVATLFVSYVAVQARYGRYDHEYHWGVTVCTWFWHALGVVWTAILAVYSIVAW